MIHAFNAAGWNKPIGVIVLGGAGDKAFCTGGDQSARAGQYDGRGLIGLPVEDLHGVIRDVPKPVIARCRMTNWAPKGDMMHRNHGTQPDGDRNCQTLGSTRNRIISAGSAAWGMQALSLYYATEESCEGVRAFDKKRKPNFRRARG